MDFDGRSVSVIGAARSGLAAAQALTRLGARVLLSDNKTPEALGAERITEIAATGATYRHAAHPEDAFLPETALVVTSPGVPRYAPVLQEAVRRGIPVWGEIELAYRLAKAPILGVTGTNGKTTITLLLAAMLEAAGKNAVICGNISADEIKKTLVDAAWETREEGIQENLNAQRPTPNTQYPTPNAYLVAEISSFQLEWVERFAPRVGILSNITPDHLDRHADFAEYAQAKARLFVSQTAEDWAIVNYDNPAAREIGESGAPGRRGWFTLGDAPPDDSPSAWVEAGELKVRLEHGAAPITLMAQAELPPTLPGLHSVANVLAAGMAALAVGAEPEAIAAAVRGFRGVPHRMEFVAEIAGVRYINNSMCTNVSAAIHSIEAMDRPAVVIMGGADKGSDFAPLVPTLQRKAKAVVLIGRDAEKLKNAFRAGGYDSLFRAETLEEAVSLARTQTIPGEAVLLAPACASFDMFRDFEARGVAFRRVVSSQ